MINPICGSPFIKPLNLLVAQKEYAVSSICDTNEEEQLQLEREKAEAAKRSRAAAQAKAKASMEGFLSGGIPGPPESVEISSPHNFVHEARGSLSRPPAASRLASKPRVRERDLSDAEFYYVYSMTRQEFKRLGILKRAWLRSENMHRRPYLGDSS